MGGGGGSGGQTQGSSGNSTSAASSAQGDAPVGIKPSPSQHAALSLTHLRKLYSDFVGTLVSSSSQGPGSEADRQVRLYSMLPLFCRVFSHCSAGEMLDKFPEVAGFCQHVSRLAVTEIRKRASNQSTIAASSTIAKFLEMDSAEEASNGWMLLTTLNLLSLGN